MRAGNLARRRAPYPFNTRMKTNRWMMKAALAVAALLAARGALAQIGARPNNMPSNEEMTRGVDPRLLNQLAQLTAQIQANPQNVAALDNRGVVSLTISRKSPLGVFWLYVAAVDLEKAIQMAPNDFYARHNYAEVCFRYGDAPNDHSAMNLAVSQYTKAIEIRPNSARSYMGRSWAYLMLGDEARFEADARRALQLDPSLQTDMQKEVAGIRENRRQGAAAQETLRRMGTYYVQGSAHTATQCAQFKGYWTNSECRISTAMNPMR